MVQCRPKEMHRVLFYSTAIGNAVIRDWLRDFSPKDRAILGWDLQRVQMGFPMGLPLCRSLGGGLWEVRSTLTDRTEARMIFHFVGPAQTLVVLNGFIKKSQKTPKSEIELALRRRREFGL